MHAARKQALARCGELDGEAAHAVIAMAMDEAPAPTPSSSQGC